MRYLHHVPSTISVRSAFLHERRPDNRGKWETFSNYIWNKDERTVCNRGAKSFVVSIYLVFLIGMFGLFFGLLLSATSLLFRTNPDLPFVRKTMMNPNGSPGLSFIPNIAKLHSPMIWYKSEGLNSIHNMRAEPYIKEIDTFFQKYRETFYFSNLHSNCTPDTADNKICTFNVEKLNECGSTDYGYDSKKPCFYLKMNKVCMEFILNIYLGLLQLDNWNPEYFGDNLPEEMPQYLKNYIKKQTETRMVWVSCKGKYFYDIEHMASIQYYPQPGFPGYYFPYRGGKDYLSPLVAVKINSLEPGYLISLECKMWAKNIESNTNVLNVQIYVDRE